MTTPLGKSFGANFYTSVVGILRRPRPDGGRIVVVSNHAWSWPQQVAVLDAQGRRVAEYWHPGWLDRMLIVDLDDDGVEEIILGGVNNAYGELGWSATVVVLDSRRVWGQGEVPPGGDGGDRRVQGVAPGSEAAILLFPEFAREDPNPHHYARVDKLEWSNGYLDVRVGKSSGIEQVYVMYQLDRRLRVAAVVPSLHLQQTLPAELPPNAPFAMRYRQALDSLGKVKALRNRFAGLP